MTLGCTAFIQEAFFVHARSHIHAYAPISVSLVQKKHAHCVHNTIYYINRPLAAHASWWNSSKIILSTLFQVWHITHIKQVNINNENILIIKFPALQTHLDLTKPLIFPAVLHKSESSEFMKDAVIHLEESVSRLYKRLRAVTQAALCVWAVKSTPNAGVTHTRPSVPCHLTPNTHHTWPAFMSQQRRYWTICRSKTS